GLSGGVFVLDVEFVVVVHSGWRGPRPVGGRAGGRGRTTPARLTVPELGHDAVPVDLGVGVVGHDVEVHLVPWLHLLRRWRDCDGEWLVGAGVGVPAERPTGCVVAVPAGFGRGGRRAGGGRRGPGE